MSYQITAPQRCHTQISLPASKSISNRALILNALSHSEYPVKNLSDCDDTRVMINAFSNGKSEIDILAAGTSMRFLTAYLSQQSGEWYITGSQRMKERPIGLLVEALTELGGRVSYTEKEGFPPLRIVGKELSGGTLRLSGGVSSQYISALLMIAPTMKKGLELELSGDIISRPYVRMTLKLMQQYGVSAEWKGNRISVLPQSYKAVPFRVESDWSGASYWYEIVSLLKDCDIELTGLLADSTQGDSRIAEFFVPLGVITQFTKNGVRLTYQETKCTTLALDLSDQPDLAQTLVVTCTLKEIPFHFTGLQSLKIKETDRINALKCELKKLGYCIGDRNDSELFWNGERCDAISGASIDTYEDHRMAMAFAPASIIHPDMVIRHPEVVSKSYPAFWQDLQSGGFTIIDLKL